MQLSLSITADIRSMLILVSMKYKYTERVAYLVQVLEYLVLPSEYNVLQYFLGEI